MPVQCTCFVCGATVLRYPCRAGGRNYCSRSCRSRGVPAFPVRMSDDGLTAEVPLRTKDGSVCGWTLVDADKAEWANQWTWGVANGGYATRWQRINGIFTNVVLHRVLLGLTTGDGLEGDHRDRNRLNNRLSNLLVVTTAEQMQNKSSYRGSTSAHRGVSLHRTGKWQASISVGGKMRYLGLFSDEAEAAQVALAARQALMPFATD